jgi:hypothetical protein
MHRLSFLAEQDWRRLQHTAALLDGTLLHHDNVGSHRRVQGRRRVPRAAHIHLPFLSSDQCRLSWHHRRLVSQGRRHPSLLSSPQSRRRPYTSILSTGA